MSKEIRLRPLFVGCVSMYLGVWILNGLLSYIAWGKKLLYPGIFLLIAAVVVLVLELSPWRRNARRKSGKRLITSCIPVLIAFLAGCSAACWFTWKEEIRQEYYDNLNGREAQITGIVMDTNWATSYYGYYTVYVDSMDGEKAGFLISLQAEELLESGIGVSGTVTFETLGLGEIYDPHQREYSRSKGVRAEAVAMEIHTSERSVPPVQQIQLWGKRVQKYLSGILMEELGEEAGGFSAALFLGNVDVLPDRVDRDFMRLGITHVLALSGTHLTIVTGLSSALGRRFSRRLGNGLSIGISVLYMTISGFTPSVVRAGIMLLICLFLRILGKGSDSFTNAGISVCTIILCNPGAARDVGLLLSFWGVMAVLLYNRATKKPMFGDTEKRRGVLVRLKNLAKETGSLFLLALCASLFILPLSCLFFGYVSILASPACVVFTLLTTILLWLIPLLLLVSPSPLFVGLVLPAVRALCQVTFAIAAQLSKLRNICISMQYPFAPVLTLAIFCFVFWALVAARGKRRPPILGTAAMVLLFGIAVIGWRVFYADQTQTAMVNSGMDEGVWTEKNDGLVIAEGEKVLLVDISSGGYSVLRRGATTSEAFYATEIEAVMLTHLHSKHIETLEKLWNRNMVRQVWIPEEDSKTAYQLYERADAAGVKIVTYTPGETLSFGKTKIITYESGFLDRSVQPIIRLDVEAKEERLVYLGSSYAEAYGMEEIEKISAGVLWFGAHGPLYKKEVDASALPNVQSVFLTGDAFQYVHIGSIPVSAYIYVFPRE